MHGSYSAWTVTLVLAFSACGGGAGSPQAALEAYSDALQDGDHERAYGLMSEEFRAKHSQADFARILKDNKTEADETASRLRNSSARVEVSAEFSYGLGERMRLIREDGEWRIASNPVAFYSQKTPKDAVRSFVRAYQLRRWDVMLRFIPKNYRNHMTVKTVELQFQGPRKDEIATMMNILEANLDSPSSDLQKGNQARIRYGDSYEVELVREDGLWKIRRL